MRLRVLSDLHLEFGPFVPEVINADAVVLAGDTDLGVRGLEWARRSFENSSIIYVPGNHEYYGHATPKILKAMRARSLELGIQLLSDDTVVLGNVRFLGLTLWTDFELMGHRDSAAETARAQMRDYRKIRIDPQYRKLMPSDTLGWHRASGRWLEKQLAEPFDGKTVIVSHHAPSPRSIQPEFARDELSAAYASNLESLIESSGAALWIHGHTHFNVDYIVGQMRVMTNQRGYVDEPSANFNPKLVLEI